MDGRHRMTWAKYREVDPDTMIPAESREVVFTREHGLCARCCMRGSEWHHRRSRRVRGLHRHCACNGVLLCRTCHRWAHSNLWQASEDGWIVSIHEEFPASVPQHRPDGWWITLCDGGGMALRADRVVIGITGRPVVLRP
jgi:5-methylcytosine-specific restriction enzyme A